MKDIFDNRLGMIGLSHWIVLGLFVAVLMLPSLCGAASKGKTDHSGSLRGYSAVSFKSELLAGEIAKTTGIALNPILCMSALGAYRYYSTPEKKRSSLPWHALPVFWGPVTLVLFLIFLKDSSKIALPKVLTVPLDALETLLEKKTSALLALPVLISSVMQGKYEQTQHVAGLVVDFFFPVALAGGGLDMAVQTGGDMLSKLIALLVVVSVFVVVWMLSHALNILILLSPFSTLDMALASLRNTLVAAVFWFADTPFGPLLAGCVIVFAVVLFPRALRLVVFGTVMSWDIILYRLFRRSADNRISGGAVSVFSSCWFGGISPMTYGSIRQEGGNLIFSYRPCYVGKLCSIDTGVAVTKTSLHVGILSPVITMAEQHGEKDFLQLFRLRAKYYYCPEEVARVLTTEVAEEESLLGKFSQCIQWCSQLLRKAPHVDISHV